MELLIAKNPLIVLCKLKQGMFAISIVSYALWQTKKSLKLRDMYNQHS